jgi:signal transduction histidine kinase
MKLKDHQFLQFFDAPYAQKLLDASTLRHYEAGDILFEEGDDPDSVYLVLTGGIVLSKRSASGQQHNVATVVADDYFGEFGFIDCLGRSARACASEPSDVASIDVDSIQDVVNQAPGRSLLHITQKIAGYVRQTNRRVIREIVHKEKLSMVGEMANSIIHDFKSPFAVIKMASQMIEASETQGEIRHFSQLIQSQITRMVAMTAQVLEYSRGTNNMLLVPTTLRELCATFDSYNREFLSSHNVELELETCEANIHVDSGKMLRVLQNLVSNAAEAMPDGGTVRVACRNVGDDQVEILVSDEGPGIADEIRDSIFEPFVTYGKRSGTGLGTAIAKTLIEAHGGTIELAEDSPGATFRIRLPCSSLE